jgi:hypothetical protein
MSNLCANCPTKKQAACLECAKCGVTVACENYGEMLLLRDDMTESTTDVVTDGLKHDGGKPRLDLVPPEIIEAVGAVMTHGAEKYGEASYKDVEPKRYRAALMRHICKWLKDPHGTDEDSGLPHLWHIACNVAFLCELDNFYDVKKPLTINEFCEELAYAWGKTIDCNKEGAEE